MSSTRLEIIVDDKQVLAAMERLRKLVRDDTPIMRAIGVGMVENVRRRFERAEDPWGRPWAPLLPAYAAIKKGPGILREAGMRGGLMGSITFSASRGHVTIGTNKIYGAVHQYGATIKPKNAKALVFQLLGAHVHAKSVRIPARPYLGWGVEDHHTVLDVVEAFSLRAIRGR